MQEVYKTWTISVENKAYKIIGFGPDGKAYVLYGHIGTSTNKKVYDQFGNQLFDAYESDSQAMEKAKAYIDIYSDRLEKYLYNKIGKRLLKRQQK